MAASMIALTKAGDSDKILDLSPPLEFDKSKLDLLP